MEHEHRARLDRWLKRLAAEVEPVTLADNPLWNWKRLGRVPTLVGESGFVKQGTTAGKVKIVHR